MRFSKSLAIGISMLVVLYAIGLLLYVYFQGGVDKSIYLRG